MSNTESEVKAAFDVLERLSSVEFVHVDDGNQAGIIIPIGKKLESLKPLIDSYRTQPERLRENAVVVEKESFIDYLDRFKLRQSAIFTKFDPQPVMMGYIDYHMARPGKDNGQNEPSFVTHSVAYKFPLSAEMLAWKRASDGGFMDQQAFSFFLQDQERDIENPPLDWSLLPADQLVTVLNVLNIADDNSDIDDRGNSLLDSANLDAYQPMSALAKLKQIRFGTVRRMLDLSRGIELSGGMVAKETYNPKTGEREVRYSETTETKDSTGCKITVPDFFFIYIPVFEGGDRHLLPVRLSFRRVGTSPKWRVELVRYAALIRQAVKCVAENAGAATGLPVFYGER